MQSHSKANEYVSRKRLLSAGWNNKPTMITTTIIITTKTTTITSAVIVISLTVPNFSS